jgi:hypothetical protein
MSVSTGSIGWSGGELSTGPITLPDDDAPTDDGTLDEAGLPDAVLLSDEVVASEESAAPDEDVALSVPEVDRLPMFVCNGLRSEASDPHATVANAIEHMATVKCCLRAIECLREESIGPMGAMRRSTIARSSRE